MITAGEILSSFFGYSEEEIFDQQTMEDFESIKNQVDNGPKVVKRISSRLRGIKKTFVKSLCSLLDEAFYETAESRNLDYADFKSEGMGKHIGAAYDLRSKYVHTGIPFGRWIEPRQDYNDLQWGRPSVRDPDFSRILQRAPTLVGLERLLRYCLLRFMFSRELLDMPLDKPV